MAPRLIAACTVLLLAGCATGAATASSAPTAATQPASAAAAPAKLAAKQPVCDYEAMVGTRIKTRTCRTPDDGADGRAAAQDAMMQMQMRGAQQNGTRLGGGG